MIDYYKYKKYKLKYLEIKGGDGSIHNLKKYKIKYKKYKQKYLAISTIYQDGGTQLQYSENPVFKDHIPILENIQQQIVEELDKILKLTTCNSKKITSMGISGIKKIATLPTDCMTSIRDEFMKYQECMDSINKNNIIKKNKFLEEIKNINSVIVTNIKNILLATTQLSTTIEQQPCDTTCLMHRPAPDESHSQPKVSPPLPTTIGQISNQQPCGATRLMHYTAFDESHSQPNVSPPQSFQLTVLEELLLQVYYTLEYNLNLIILRPSLNLRANIHRLLTAIPEDTIDILITGGMSGNIQEITEDESRNGIIINLMNDFIGFMNKIKCDNKMILTLCTKGLDDIKTLFENAIRACVSNEKIEKCEETTRSCFKSKSCFKECLTKYKIFTYKQYKVTRTKLDTWDIAYNEKNQIVYIEEDKLTDKHINISKSITYTDLTQLLAANELIKNQKLTELNKIKSDINKLSAAKIITTELKGQTSGITHGSNQTPKQAWGATL